MDTRKYTKRAFTLVEMLVCMVCIAVLTIAVASFHRTVTNQTFTMQRDEEASLLEHSDISRLRASKTIDADLIATLNHTTYVAKAIDVKIGDPIAFDHGLAITGNQVVVFESADQTIATIDETSGSITGLSSGITYITATACNVGTNGEFSKTAQCKTIPIRVYDDSTMDRVTAFDMYYYSGQFYAGWFISVANGGVSP